MYIVYLPHENATRSVRWRYRAIQMSGMDYTDTHLSSVECFDPSTGMWSPMAEAMSTSRSFGAVVALECPAE